MVHLGLSSSRAIMPRFYLSKLLRPLNLLPHPQPHETTALPKMPSSEQTTSMCKSHRLLVDQGVVRPVHNCPGMFHYLPLAIRSLEKLTRLIDECMREIECQKILMPSLTPGDAWKATGRWNSMGKELVRLSDRHDKAFVLSPTHEEAVTMLVATLGHPLSYRQLPLKLYQVSSKFRDEMLPKFGLIRSREFLMKDLYTFDRDYASAERTYDQVTAAYDKLFGSLGVPFLRVEGDSGAMGGSVSHEYHYVADIGQDALLVCANCGGGKNRDVNSDECCANCQGKMVMKKGIEVGHTFLLGDKYSLALEATYLSDKGKPEVMQMGCYGLGVSRIMAASVEYLCTDRELRWPDKIVPFSVAVLTPKAGSKEAIAVANNALDFYDHLNAAVFPGDVVLDDRGDVTVGGKLREARKTGYRFVILFGKDSVNQLVEVYDIGSSGGDVRKMSLEAAVEYLRGQL